MTRLTSTAICLVLVALLAACSSGTDSTPTLGDVDDATTTTAGSEPPQPGAAITISGFTFSGAGEVAVGQTVTVTNDDTVGHTWTADDGEFDSGTLGEGESFEHTFDEAGEYDYFCSIHPQMAGTITVEG